MAVGTPSWYEALLRKARHHEGYWKACCTYSRKYAIFRGSAAWTAICRWS